MYVKGEVMMMGDAVSSSLNKVILMYVTDGNKQKAQ